MPVLLLRGADPSYDAWHPTEFRCKPVFDGPYPGVLRPAGLVHWAAGPWTGAGAGALPQPHSGLCLRYSFHSHSRALPPSRGTGVAICLPHIITTPREPVVSWCRAVRFWEGPIPKFTLARCFNPWLLHAGHLTHCAHAHTHAHTHTHKHGHTSHTNA